MSYPPQVLLLYCSDYTIARFGNSRKEFPPLGLLYLAAACEQANIHVQLLDIASTSDSDLPFYDIIGLSINSSYVYPSFKKKSPIIRSRCKYMLVGGQHTTLFPKQTLEDLNADFALIGEGEISLPKLILALYNKAPIEINGVYKRSSPLKYICKEPQRIENLDALPFPSRHLLPREDILLQNRIPYHDVYSTTIITSRGCPYNCNFCGNIYKKFFHRSGENVLKEIQFIQSQYPEIKGIVFMDENLLFSLDHSKDIISVMSHFNLKWTCNARADGFTQEILPFLRNSGCVEIKYGIESGCQKILTAMNKGITIQTIEQTLKQTSNAGINTKCFLMFGYPGDGIESAQETISFLERNKKYIHRVNLFSFSPVPNSPIFQSGIFPNSSWEDYKIYHQLNHWWGSDEEYSNMKRGYKLLQDYISCNYPNN